jgi:hypothetical protein
MDKQDIGILIALAGLLITVVLGVAALVLAALAL